MNGNRRVERKVAKGERISDFGFVEGRGGGRGGIADFGGDRRLWRRWSPVEALGWNGLVVRRDDAPYGIRGLCG